MTKEVTLGEFFDAMEKNGFRKIKRTFLEHDKDRKIIGGCAIGQAAVNLGVNPSYLRDALLRISATLPDRIITQNDYTFKKIPDIARNERKRYGEKTLSRKMILAEVEYEV